MSSKKGNAIFGETVYSPCNGPVIATIDSLSNQIPPTTDREHPAGNHVVITGEGVNVLLALLQNGRVTV